ncbi:methyltransferase domain-containing protein [Pedococcus sp. KACC 23699]|uniref:Methyltransferase domain-containing protein n=1 Tax=Pedococcus sp. KACC 23699 TaxID=3149228 RepID=A0AAU7JSH3_9MICO
MTYPEHDHTAPSHDHQAHGHQGHDHAEGVPRGLGPGDGDWDERYAASEQIWSGQPNGSLVSQVAHLEAGRALDVGCGEGADAVWLARAGWQVTALDVAGVALGRAAKHAQDAGVAVEWVHSGLVEAGLPAGTFDLVNAQYPVLARTPDHESEHVLLDLVAPGGTLLVVHHSPADMAHAREQGWNPDEYVFPGDVAKRLGEDWVVEEDATRPRDVPLSGGGMHHTQDVVLRARRLR